MDGAYQVITLSAMGEAETPAGGSVCIRCAPINDGQHPRFPIVGRSTNARREIVNDSLSWLKCI